MAHGKNIAYVLHGLNDARLEPYPLPSAPGPKEVQLRSLSTGICGSDIHYLKEMALGKIKVTEKFVLGHEASAEIVAVGSEVKDFKVGDRVCTEPAIYCQQCKYCKNLDTNLCEVAATKCPPYNGSLTYYYNHPQDFVFKVPDNVSNEAAAMIEPLCVAVYACKRAQVTVGSKVFITGSGPIGLLNLIVARAYGATRIVLTDIKPDRLKLAKELGADETILVTKDMTEEQLIQKVTDAFHGELPDITMESSGVASNFRLVFWVTRPKGTIMLVGMGPTEILLPIAEAANKECVILSVFRYRGVYPLAIELAASGKLPLEKLITHRYTIEQSDKAFEAACKGEGVKIMIKIAD